MDGDKDIAAHRIAPGRAVAAPGAAVLQALVLLEASVAMTGNTHAVITQFGSYLNASARGQSFQLCPGMIGLRSEPAAISEVRLSTEEGTSGQISTLHLLSESGRPVHRCRTASDSDRLVLESLDRQESTGATVAESLGERVGTRYRPAPEAPDAHDQLGQLDALLDDSGRCRRQGMDPLPSNARIDPSVLPLLLEHLCTAGVPLGVIVVGSGVLQGVAGRIHVTSAAEGGLMARWNDATVELDLRAVAECLRVTTDAAHGATTAVELYDDADRCIAVLGQFGMVGADTHAVWEDVVASLP